MLNLSEIEFVVAINTAFQTEMASIHIMFQLNGLDSFSSSLPIHRDEKMKCSTVLYIENGLRAMLSQRMCHASFSVARHTVMIGDVAHCVYSLAEQEFNISISDVVRLSHAIHYDVK
jgi:2-polyprenyl-6-methoxyphenol hydroxylase-like FAD-dependent oxidoreductase